jgi:uncharacterized protein YdhG (YjbR/CyaY superfamily)
MKINKEIDKHIKFQDKNAQTLLNKLREVIQSSAPKAEEVIKYGIPTYTLNGKSLVHFSGFKKHIGFFPTPSAITEFKNELSSYKLSKGTIQFPLDKPLPITLIKKIVKFRLKEVLSSKNRGT